MELIKAILGQAILYALLCSVLLGAIYGALFFKSYSSFLAIAFLVLMGAIFAGILYGIRRYVLLGSKETDD